MENIVVAIVILIILASAIVYIVRAKKQGVKCIGCPMGAACSAKDKKTSGCGGGSCSGC